MKKALFIVCAVISIASAAKNVTISKCCKFDEYLSSTENKCIYSEEHLTWKDLRIFSRATKQNPAGYLFKIPPTWHLKENYKPNCPRPALMSRGLDNYMPFLDGSLFVKEYEKKVHPLNYCIDYSAALICLEEPESISSRLKVKKCCGKGLIFSTAMQSCIIQKDKNDSYQIDLGPNVTITAGYPTCPTKNSAIAFMATLDDAVFQPTNGSLWLSFNKIMLPVQNYCLEHVLENNGKI